MRARGRITALLWTHFNFFTLDEAFPVSDGMLYEMSRTGFAECQMLENVNEVSKYIGVYFNIAGQEKIIGIVFLKLAICSFWKIVLNIFTYKKYIER